MLILPSQRKEELSCNVTLVQMEMREDYMNWRRHTAHTVHHTRQSAVCIWQRSVSSPVFCSEEKTWCCIHEVTLKRWACCWAAGWALGKCQDHMFRRILTKGHHWGKCTNVRSAAGCNEDLSEVRGQCFSGYHRDLALHRGRSYHYQ